MAPGQEITSLHDTVTDWFTEHARALPWRAPGTSPWGVLVSEVMSQQTPVARVAPAWQAWLQRWPRPSDLAAASPADVLRAWDRLGYPRRALRLQDCARIIAAEHDDEVPADEATLLTLPGIGAYTAAAVVAFAHGGASVVLDTNVRRVLARLLDGEALAPPHLSRAERERAAAVLPHDAARSVVWNAGLMELGALVCTARSPRCSACPLAARCAWFAAGRPADAHVARRRRQPWQGTDRQARGRVMRLLRDAPDGTAVAEPDVLSMLSSAGTEGAQATRVLASLLADNLVVRCAPPPDRTGTNGGPTVAGRGPHYRLPGHT